jgi:DNA oxidative demethylase
VKYLQEISSTEDRLENLTGKTAEDAPPPPGLRHVAELVTEEEESELLEHLQRMPMDEVRMRGQVARRTVRHFGLAYGYDSFSLRPTEALPGFLEPLRARAAELAEVDAPSFAETLVTRYPPGATIGWHRDAPMFGVVAGVSLGSACRMRFRRGEGADRRLFELILEPRSAYVLSGEARSSWQHSIPAVKALRWSVTFRTLRRPGRWLADAG